MGKNDVVFGAPRFGKTLLAENERLKTKVERLKSENARLNGQQSAVRDMAASEVDDLKEEIAARDARIAELEAALWDISTWRKDCHDYDADMGHDLRDFDEEEIERIEENARAALQSQAAPKEGEDE